MIKRSSILHSGVTPISVHRRDYSFAVNEPGDAPVAESEPALRWHHITMMLDACACETGAGRKTVPQGKEGQRRCAHEDRSGQNAKIQILDRPTQVTVVLSWRNPVGCSYGYQLWQRTISKRAGTCAVSGEPIRRGHTVFQPRLRSGRTGECVRNDPRNTYGFTRNRYMKKAYVP
jgi:hypothetical protein